MKTYFVQGSGQHITALNARDLVRKLRAGSSYQEKNQAAWMHAVSLRVSQGDNKRIPYQNEAAFVRGLLRVGFIKEIET